jgi:hypothetical protein
MHREGKGEPLPEDSELVAFLRKRSRERAWWESARVASRRARAVSAELREPEEPLA